MTGYLGYFFQGMQSGIQTGTQLLEMKWKKDEKKRLEQKEAELLEASSIFNNMVSTAGEDNFYSEDEQMKINAAYAALSYEVKERVEGSIKAMQAMDKKTVEENNQWFDYFKEGIEGLDPKDAQGIFDFAKANTKGEKGLLRLDAYFSLSDKRRGIVKEEQTWERGATVPAENRAEWFRQQGIDIPKAEVTPKEPTFNEKRFNWKIDQLKAGKITTDQFLKSENMYIAPEKMSALEKEIELIIKYGGTNEEIKNKLLQKGAVKPTEPKPETVTTLKNWEEMFDVNAKEGPRTEEDYNRALELLRQSEDKYTPKYPTWKEALIAEVKGIGRELEGITDRTDRKLLLGVYKQKLEEIKAKYPDVDLSQFSQPKELSGWDKFMEGIGF